MDDRVLGFRLLFLRATRLGRHSDSRRDSAQQRLEEVAVVVAPAGVVVVKKEEEEEKCGQKRDAYRRGRDDATESPSKRAGTRPS